MGALRWVVDQSVAFFCRHEWVQAREYDRMFLRCLHCGRRTGGLEVGGGGRRADRRWLDLFVSRWR